jgi:hypothetical protein
MRIKNGYALAMAVAATALGGRAQAQYQIAGSFSVPITASDDTAANLQLTYGNMLIQTIQEVTVPNGNYQGANTPYLVGTLGSTTLEAHSSSTTYTAFYYSATTGLQFFGQYNASSSAQYLSNAATYNAGGGAPIVYLDYHTIALFGENSSGEVIAYEGIEDPNSTSSGVLGRHAFGYNIVSNTYTSLGLSGVGSPTAVGPSGASYAANFNYTNNNGATTGTYSSSTPDNIDTAGEISGTTSRYYGWSGVAQSSTTSLGTSTWFYSPPGGTVETGLYGTGYNYLKSFSDGGTGTFATESDKGVNAGYSVGTATCYLDTGTGSANQDGTQAWEYSRATNTTTPIGLYAAGQTPNIAGFGSNYNGSAISYSYNYTSGTTTVSTDRSSSITALSSTGQVGGNDSYYFGAASGSKGQIAWVYTPVLGTYKQVGLTSNGFASGGTTSYVNLSAASSSTVSFINKVGTSVGYSTEYLSSGPSGSGTVTSMNEAWYTPAGGTTVPIGPTDSYHTAVSATYGSYISSSVSELTDSGLVGGTSTRYTPGTTTSNGTDPWVFDPSANGGLGGYFILDPYANSNSYFLGSITYLSDGRYAVGEYKLNSSASYSAFAWSELSGFVDLGSATPELSEPPYSDSNSNIQAFVNAFSVDDGGDTVYTTAGYVLNGLTTVDGAAVLSGTLPVPEPATLSVVAGLAAASLLRRRRRPVV